jgi:phage gp36-like protein
MFLTKEELKTTGVPEVIAKVTNDDDEIITEVILESIDEMKGYLAVNYNAEAIFQAEGNYRNKTVLKYLKKIVVYELYKRKSNLLDEDTVSSFEEAMSWLERIATGLLSAPLPAKDDDVPVGDGFIKFGGNTKYKSEF